MTFFPARAIAAQRDFVSGFCSNPRRLFPSNENPPVSSPVAPCSSQDNYALQSRPTSHSPPLSDATHASARLPATSSYISFLSFGQQRHRSQFSVHLPKARHALLATLLLQVLHKSKYVSVAKFFAALQFRGIFHNRPYFLRQLAVWKIAAHTRTGHKFSTADAAANERTVYGIGTNCGMENRKSRGLVRCFFDPIVCRLPFNVMRSHQCVDRFFHQAPGCF